jgi:hypothetical protein
LANHKVFKENWDRAGCTFGLLRLLTRGGPPPTQRGK